MNNKFVFIRVIFFSIITFLFSPLLIHAQGKTLSIQGESIKHNIILTYEDVLDQRTIPSDNQSLQKLTDIDSIVQYNRKRDSQLFPSHKALFSRFESGDLFTPKH